MKTNFNKEIEFVVDDREVRSGVLELLKSYEDVSVTVCRLAQGDYLIDDRLLVERKRLPDLVISIKDGRLFSQALRLLGTEQHPMMILEGTATDLAGSGMRREAIQGALVMVTIYIRHTVTTFPEPPGKRSTDVVCSSPGKVDCDRGIAAPWPTDPRQKSHPDWFSTRLA
ncbi:MAG: hypothetical protein O6928_00460 [Gammaproteobacteria bacterium]|nr:hypothetical protein [Gammaproteobacteria bacterium]